MARNQPRATSLNVQCDVVKESVDQDARTCPGCHCDLELHQPSLDQPSRLLGTCPACESWFFYQELPARGQTLAIRIPAASELFAFARQAPRQGPGSAATLKPVAGHVADTSKP